jgi:hypothetical protein
MHQLNDPAAFRAWLAQIAGRVCWQSKGRAALTPLLQLSMLESETHSLSVPLSRKTPLKFQAQLIPRKRQRLHPSLLL